MAKLIIEVERQTKTSPTWKTYKIVPKDLNLLVFFWIEDLSCEIKKSTH